VGEYPTDAIQRLVRVRLTDHGRAHRAMAGVDVRFRGAVAHVEGRLAIGGRSPLRRRRFRGDPDLRGYEVDHLDLREHRAPPLPGGGLVGTPEEILDLAREVNFADRDDG
jgi:hypothetical protein